jgi:cysteine desulfurase/selenocysteine lyase
MSTAIPTDSLLDLPLDEQAPPGLPDAATVARWATEFFSALPAAAAPIASIAAVAPGVTQLPYATVGEAFSFANDAVRHLSAADLRHPELPATPQLGPAAFAPLSAGTTLAGGAGGPSYYFLDEKIPSASGQRFSAFNVDAIRKDFPILSTRVHGRPLIWFDNAATTQKPSVVIERLAHFYRNENSNIHRAAHELAARATDVYEGARRQVQRFIGASSPDEIVFVRGATEAINLVAQSWGRAHIQQGDEIVISHLEHHANIVPWQQLANERGAILKVAPVDSNGTLRLDELQRLVGGRTRLIAITHVSNALGTITPVEEIVEIGHRAGARVLIDGAQSVSHIPVNVQELDADFFVLSGHKIFAPTGIGVLYGKAGVLADMDPWQGGGNMIEDVTFEQTRYQQAPARFEAGTGNIADAAGLGAALQYLDSIGMHNIERYETELLAYATEQIRTIPGLKIIGTSPHKASVLSFVIPGIEPTAIGSALNEEGIAVRAGHHCAQPILRRFGHESTVRASLAFYNTCAEVDTMIAVLRRLTATSAQRPR